MKKKGSILGGTLLITGSCIGAGMLGLPIVTGLAGFFPSLIMLVVIWLFMTTTALLMVEVLGWFKKPVNMISMVGHTLGPVGKLLCWVTYLFLFYAILVAYMSLSGNHASFFAHNFFNFSLPNWAGTLFFVVLFGWIVYLGTRKVDYVNRYLMVGKILFFIILVIFGIHYITPRLYLYWQPKYALFTAPILVIAFGFHNMVPVLMQYLGGDRKRVRITIYSGSLFAFLIYLIWELVALGILPIGDIMQSYRNDIDAAQSIRLYVGSNMIGYAAQFLAFFAILTSFLAQTLSLSHFLGDGFKVKKRERENIWMCVLALLPPLIFTMFFPELFFKALNFAGGICATLLFGIMPALMVWIGRYQKRNLLPDRVPGGKALLIAILLVASFIFFYQLTVMLNFSIFPKPH
ncbi:MAG: Tyrosine-specific transport protein [Chlamydiae bacterium]|nr:Tyrosine-specific transport protein [Chlamydiota bacterium]